MTTPNPNPNLDPNARTNPGKTTDAASPSSLRRESWEPSKSPGSPSSSPSSSSATQPKHDTTEALRCLIRSTEILIREIPRGPSARLDGVRDEIRRARQVIGDQPSSSDSPTSAQGESKEPSEERSWSNPTPPAH